MDYNRAYYCNDGYSPFLLYIIFGANPEKLKLSRKEHKVEKIPDGIDISHFTREKHTEYMDKFLEGNLGKILKEDNSILYNTTLYSEECVVLRGKIQEEKDLLYMKNVIGIIQAFIETGALSVLDIQILKLFSTKEWTKKIFETDFNPYAHSVILVSKMEDGTNWLHTRGMLKFGRPDISMLDVPDDNISTAQQVINQLIYYGVQGAVFNKSVKLHTSGSGAYIVSPHYVDDFDNFDFNNAYYRISWKECINAS